MGGKSSKNAWDLSDTTQDDTRPPPTDYRGNTHVKSANASAIPHQPVYASSHPQQPTSPLRQSAPVTQHPASIPQQPVSDLHQRTPNVSNGDISKTYFNQPVPRGHKDQEPAYQTHPHDQSNDRLTNNHTTAASAKPKQDVHKSSKKSSKSKKSKGKSSNKTPVTDPSPKTARNNEATVTIPRVVFDREKFMSDHGHRPVDNIHVLLEPSRSNEDSGRGSYGRNEDTRSKESSSSYGRREVNNVYATNATKDQAIRPLIYSDIIHQELKSRSNSRASESVRLAESDTRSTTSTRQSQERGATADGTQPQVTGFVQVLPSEPFRGWNRSNNRTEHRTGGSPNSNSNRRETERSKESPYSYRRGNLDDGYPDADY